MDKPIPQELDWVTARAECSLFAMFKKLEIGVRSDVDIRNEHRQQEDRVKWEVVGGGRRFSVVFEANSYPVPRSLSVDFELGRDAVSISDGNGLAITAAITLNHEGRCMFTVGGREVEDWQLRRMALEKIFFG